MKKIAFVLAAAAALFAFSARADEAKAAKLWKSKCSSCHGADGKSATDMGKKLKAPDFTAGLKSSDADIKSVIKEGKKGDKKIEDHSFGEKVGGELDDMVKIVRGFHK